MKRFKDTKVSLLQIGSDRNIVIVIDDFYDDPCALLSSAGEVSGFKQEPNDYYPGVKKPLSDPRYECALMSYQNDLMGAYEELSPKNMRVDSSCFAVSNTPPEQLLPIQSIPHFDTTEATQLAVVHYLFHENLGGTAFYRHKLSKFESIDNDRHNEYRKILGRQASTEGLPSPEYICGDTQLFEQIGRVEPRFNRAVIYPSNLLHSGNFQMHDNKNARLTITSNLVLKRTSI